MMHPVSAAISAHECCLILNCFCRSGRKKKASPERGFLCKSYLLLSVVVIAIVSVVSIVTVTIATLSPDLPASFATGEACGSRTVDVEITIALQNRFHRPGKITGRDALARRICESTPGANYVRGSKRARNGS